MKWKNKHSWIDDILDLPYPFLINWLVGSIPYLIIIKKRKKERKKERKEKDGDLVLK